MSLSSANCQLTAGASPEVRVSFLKLAEVEITSQQSLMKI